MPKETTKSSKVKVTQAVPIPFPLLTPSVAGFVEDRKGRKARQGQEGCHRAKTAFVCLHVLLSRLEREDQG